MSTKELFLSLNELNSKTIIEPKFIVEDLLIEGGISILAGEAKAGKSTLTRQIMAAVSNGDNLLNKKTIKTKVYYLSLEDREYFVRSSLNALDADLNNLFISNQKITDWPKAFQDFDDGESKLIVLDTMSLNINIPDLNDYSKVYAALSPFKAFATKTNSHVLMLHHLGKNKDLSNQSQMIGSTALSGVVESMIFIGKTDSGAVLNTSLRYGQNTKDLLLDYEQKTEFFSVSANQVQPVTLTKLDSLGSEILTYVKSKNGISTNNDIKKNVTGATRYIVDELRNLVDAKKLIRLGAGTRSNPYEYELPVQEREQEQNSAELTSSISMPEVTCS